MSDFYKIDPWKEINYEIVKVVGKIGEKEKIYTIFTNQFASSNKDLVILIDYYTSYTIGEYQTPWGAKFPNVGTTRSGSDVIKQLMYEKDIRSILLYPVAPIAVLSLEPEKRKPIYDLEHRRIPKVIEKLETINGKPIDGIVCSGCCIPSGFYDLGFDSKTFGRIGQAFGYKSVNTLPLSSIVLDKSNAAGEGVENLASLLGFFFDHVDQLLLGKNRYTLDVQGFQTEIVKTIDQFDRMMDVIESSPVTSWDCETTGLSRTQETILTIQIATSGKFAYILPYQHPQSPFTSSDILHMQQRFKQYFERGKSKFHIYQNAKYDIGQFFTHFKLKYYNHKIFDIMAGNFALDENRKFLNMVPGMGNVRPYALDFVANNYGGNGIFEQGVLGKSDRTTLETQSIEDIGEYGAKDVCIPYQVAKFQLQEAKRRGDHGFLRLVTEQISNMIMCFTIMEHNGAPIDKKYLIDMKDANSPLNTMLKEAQKKFNQTKSVITANDILLEKHNFSVQPSAFGLKKWIFDINKLESQQALFFDVLGLAPTSYRKDGGGSVGKEFKAHYKNVPEVALLDRHDKIKKVKSTFMDAHWERFSTDKDLRADSRLRANYGFTGVVTGRASASDPNLQQIPSHGEFCKIVKRQFVARPNRLFLKADYSAHEVRNWGNVSGDAMVCAAFDFGKQLRKELRYLFASDKEYWDKFKKLQADTLWKGDKEKGIDPLTYDQKTELISKIDDKKLKRLAWLMFELENKGDVHKLNYELFYGKPAYLVTPDERQSIKSVVFGVIYGKGIPALAADIGCSEQQAQEIYDTMFTKFEVGGEWLKEKKARGRIERQVVSPLGRVRHLNAYLHTDRSIQGSMDRKGPNSLIQGFASDIGFMSGKLMQDLCWNWFWKRGIDFDFTYMNVVHDSTENECRIRHLPIAMYMGEHAYTTLAHKRCKELFNIDLVCGWEIEQELGGSFAHMEVYKNFCQFEQLVTEAIKWSEENLDGWSIQPGELEDCLHNYEVLQKYRREELKQLKGVKVDNIMLLNEDNILDIGLKL